MAHGSPPGAPPRLKAVAFDLDSTLTDFLRFKRLATESAALAMVDAGLDMEPKLAQERLWEKYREAGLDGDVAFERFLRETLGRVDDHVLWAGIQAYQRAKQAHLEPYPRTVETLVGLVRRGLVLAIITDAERHKAHQRLAALRLAPFFEYVITRDDTLNGKGDEKPFLMLLRLLHARPGEVLMVGDHRERDVRPAKRAGLHTALAQYGAQAHYATLFPEDEPDFVLRRIDDLVGVVDALGGPGSVPPFAAAVEPEEPVPAAAVGPRGFL